jgi:protein-S-isoprenylcysteine O-methyltransferase Ste14
MLAWMTECVSGAYTLQMVAAIGELRWGIAERPAWAAVPIAVGLALVGVIAVSWQHSRARSRWHTALDAYAEREIIRQKRRITLKEMQPAPAQGERNFSMKN